jgi:hypothetical protein
VPLGKGSVFTRIETLPSIDYICGCPRVEEQASQPEN